MNDQYTDDQNQSDPRDDRDFPEWPVPQEPYLEPPLESTHETGDDPAEPKSEPEPGQTNEETTVQPENQKLKASRFTQYPASSSLHQATQEIQVFHSPYFPRGIYEDAQSVEAFYGRHEPKPGYDPFPEADPTRIKRKFPNLYRPILLVIAALLIIIMLLASASGISLLTLF